MIIGPTDRCDYDPMNGYSESHPAQQDVLSKGRSLPRGSQTRSTQGFEQLWDGGSSPPQTMVELGMPTRHCLFSFVKLDYNLYSLNSAVLSVQLSGHFRESSKIKCCFGSNKKCCSCERHHVIPQLQENRPSVSVHILNFLHLLLFLNGVASM